MRIIVGTQYGRRRQLAASGQLAGAIQVAAHHGYVRTVNRKVLSAVLAGVLLAPIPAAGAAAAPPPTGLCRNATPARPAIPTLPWAQRLLDPDRVWPHSTGNGVLVAVVDSGVDSDHPQLRRKGKVLAGEDFFQVGKLRANFDCDSHGTGVAGIIAADQVDGIGFHGLAPNAIILPVRVSERETTDGTSNAIDPVVLANGIRYAADRGAKVINLSMAGFRDEPLVRSAVAYAQSKDALIVAAAGNSQRDDFTLPSYPAAYKDVLGVGAIDIQGKRVEQSQIGPYVDLVAPGASVIAPTRRGGHQLASGTSFAAPFVAATAALVRSAWPKLTAKQVAARLMATASPARGGGTGTAYGAGVVDPYRAVTDGLSAAKPKAMAPMVKPPPDQAALQAIADEREVQSSAWQLIGLIAGLALVSLLLAVVLPAGVRRNWSARRADPIAVDSSRDDPPDQLFLLPRPPSER